MDALFKKELDATLKNHIRDHYKGNVGQFYAAEGQQYFNDVLGLMQ